MITWTRTVRLLITKTVGHGRVFLFSHLTYLLQLLYLGKLLRPRYKLKLNKIMKFHRKMWFLLQISICQSRVELSCVGEVSIATQLNSTSNWVELCRYKYPLRRPLCDSRATCTFTFAWICGHFETMSLAIDSASMNGLLSDRIQMRTL